MFEYLLPLFLMVAIMNNQFSVVTVRCRGRVEVGEGIWRINGDGNKIK